MSEPRLVGPTAGVGKWQGYRSPQNVWTRIQRTPATERGFKPSPADSFRVFRPRRCAARSEAGLLRSARQRESRAAGRAAIFRLAGVQIDCLTDPAAPAKEQATR